MSLSNEARRITGALILACVAAAASASAGPPHLVKDIDDATQSGGPGIFLREVGGVLYFDAKGFLYRSSGMQSGTYPVYPRGPACRNCTAELGSTLVVRALDQIFRTDGTVSGTFPLKTFPFSSTSTLAKLGSYAYFDASSYGSNQLWRTDGTVPGTVLVRASAGNSGIGNIVATSDKVYFTTDEAGQQKLFVSDGSSGGTVSLGTFFVTQPVAAGRYLFFLDSQQSVWVTDGTPSGTRLLRAFSWSDHPTGLTAAGSRLLFRCSADGHGDEPWVSDGTPAGTSVLRDVEPGPAGSSASDFRVLGSNAYFVVYGNLWRTDGTPAGTEIVLQGLGINGLPPGRTKLVFLSGNPARRLWMSDGSAAGTVLLRESDSLRDLPFPGAEDFAGRLYFPLWDTRFGTELWSTDGSMSGTALFVDLNRSTDGQGIKLMTAGATRAYFSHRTHGFFSTDGTEAGTSAIAPISGYVSSIQVVGDIGYVCGAALWRTDGTDTGTTALSPPGQVCAWAVPSSATLFFATRAPSTGNHSLWRTDGSPEGTEKILDLVPRDPSGAVAFGSSVLFLGDGAKLWISDGTAAGTRIVKDTVSGSGEGVRFPLVVVGSTAYFMWAGPAGSVLWSTDGTSMGTVPVAGSPRVFALAGHFDGVLYFAGSAVPGEPIRLWRTDGTSVGTRVVATNPGGVSSSHEYPPVVSGSRVFFVAGDPGTRLWVSDGTESGTQPVTPVISIRTLTPVPGGLAFSGSSEPWFSDGTPFGTRCLGDVTPGVNGSNPEAFARLGSMLLFSATDHEHGWELWRADLEGDGRMFYTVVPCRVADTRTDGDGPALVDGATRDIKVTGICGVPADAAGVVLNVTVTQPTGDGYLEVLPAGRASTGARSTAFRVGQTRASAYVLGLDPTSAGSTTLRLFASGHADVILDVSGYFR